MSETLSEKFIVRAGVCLVEAGESCFESVGEQCQSTIVFDVSICRDYYNNVGIENSVHFFKVT